MILTTQKPPHQRFLIFNLAGNLVIRVIIIHDHIGVSAYHH